MKHRAQNAVAAAEQDLEVARCLAAESARLYEKAFQLESFRMRAYRDAWQASRYWSRAMARHNVNGINATRELFFAGQRLNALWSAAEIAERAEQQAWDLYHAE